jgi:rhodanese-related sulfurtransferase
MRTISRAALRDLLESEQEYALFDIRETGEYNAGHIPGATSLPRRDLEFRLADLVPVRDTRVIVAGDGTERENLAASTIDSCGYGAVYALDGGVAAWSNTGYSLETGVNVPSKNFGETIHETRAVPEIEPRELHARLERGEALGIFDTRMPAEFGRFCIPGGLNVPGGDLILWADDLKQRPETIVVNCAGRTRSIIGTETLRRLGLKNVFALKNGTMGWLLAGLDLEREPKRTTQRPSERSLLAAEQLAAEIAADERIPFVSVSELRDLMSRRHKRTLYAIDVRSLEEYRSGHIPGFLAVPGGQAVQRADDFVAVRSGTIVFACAQSARAVMAAYWYLRMGFKNTFVLKGGVQAWLEAGYESETGAPTTTPLGIERARSRVDFITGDEAAAAAPDGFILDVGLSTEYAAGHLPGAAWLSRSRLEEIIPPLYTDRRRPFVVTCADGRQSTFAAATLKELGYRNARVLEGGTERWRSQGRPLEIGLTRPLAEANDVVLSASMTGDKEAMRKYLEWELRLGGKYEKS